jgi:5-methylcytosine-specific restriction protein B
MGLDRQVVDQLVALVRKAYPGWKSFGDERTVHDERRYKLEAVEKAVGPDGLLLEAALRQDIEGRALNSFIDRFDRIGQATNLLFRSVPLSGDLSALYLARDSEPQVLERFCNALLDLLWGQGSSPERLERYLSVVSAEGLPSKWTLPTYFLFLTHPDEDICIKPRIMRRVAKELATPWTAQGNPSAEEYAAILNWAHDLQEALQPFGAQDMVDVQSFLWVAGSELGKPTAPPETKGNWKIAPGPQGSNWTTCKDGAHISVGWDELGDLSKMTREEFETQRDGLIAAGSDHTVAGCEQAWKFAHDISEGDGIVANQGISRILGFGRVTGPYYFVPDGTDRHRLPVEWFDTAPRQLAAPRHDWQQTLVPLATDDFAALLALPPEQPALAPPFDTIFADRAEADRSFDLMADALKALGVSKNDDERFAVTLNAEAHLLTLDFGPWCVMRWGRAARPNRVQLALLADAPGTTDFPVNYRFKTEDDLPVVLRRMGPAALSPEVRGAFLETARHTGELFGGRRVSNYRRSHVQTIANALLEAEKRDELLTSGLTSPHLASDAAFGAEAQELLERFSADPTKSFYAANKDALTKHVQQPVHELLLTVAERIAPPLREALETNKRLFSIFPKNDYGRGGAWPYYWGAFYPIGGKKGDGCQLYVSLGEGGLTYGFSIGDFAGEARKRFAHSIEEHREAIVPALADSINAPDFSFGDSTDNGAAETPEGLESLDLADWLAQGDKIVPGAHVFVPWDELLGIERERLIDDVTNAFDRLFPLVLLGTSEHPMPDIRAYMEGDLEGAEGPEPNPPYSLDDLVAETSLPKKSLEAWLRAIDRKGQAILYGPPGTGKTYVAERLAKHLVAGGTGAAELLQFHPAYAYEDFMQGMRPKARDGGGLDYPIMDGRFKQFCDQARGRDGLSVLIIDEVNRANLARVFGELMYLLEYRDKSIPLAAGGRFSIPANVRLIGTMNTADRSIALVDHALRRRFAFLPLYPDYQMLTDYHTNSGSGYDPAKLIEVLRELNRKISDHHYEVGTSFFMRPDIAEQLPDVWSMEIEPYLEEYFFDQQGTVDSYRWAEVKKKLGAE